MSGPDVDKALQDDVKKLKGLNSGATKPSPPKLIESVFWGLALLALTFMIVSMPWVGAGKLIPGTAWLTVSLGGMSIFGALALLTRLTFGSFGRQMDSQLSNRFEGRR